MTRTLLVRVRNPWPFPPFFFRVWFVYIRGMKFYPELFSEVPWYMAWSRHDGHERPLRVSAEYERRPTPLDRHYRYFRKQVRYFVW